MKQTVGNACGTVGILHAIGNGYKNGKKSGKNGKMGENKSENKDDNDDKNNSKDGTNDKNGSSNDNDSNGTICINSKSYLESFFSNTENMNPDQLAGEMRWDLGPRFQLK